jgi:uncharacterized protein (DUF58 family)
VPRDPQRPGPAADRATSDAPEPVERPGLRGALSAMTVRGRSLLAAGVACLVSAVILGELDLLRIGVLLIVLPLAATAVLTATPLRLDCRRSIAPRRVSAGALVSVTAQLQNAGRRPTPALLAEDLMVPVIDDADAPTLPDGWTVSPRFPLDRMAPGEVRTLRYTLRPPRRGVYELGPLAVRLCDPFGFTELPRTFAATDRLLVLPETVHLPRVDLLGRWSAGGTGSGSGAGTSGDDEVGTRPYRLGDELRRVHWRTTARVGELSVRREEQPRQGSVTLVLDVRPAAWVTAAGRRDGFETAVAVLASIAVALIEAGTALRLVTLEGRELAAVPGRRLARSAEAGRLLESLATLEPGYRTAPHGGPVAPAAEPSGPGDLVVAVLGRTTAADARLLARMTTAPGLALAVGSGAGIGVGPTGGAGGRGATAIVAASGWRTAEVPDLADLPLVWQRLAEGPVLTGRTDRR